MALATQVEAATWRLGLPFLAVGVVLAAVAARRSRGGRNSDQDQDQAADESAPEPRPEPA